MLIAISGQQITYISQPLHNKNVGQTWQQCENMWQEMKKKCGSRKMQQLICGMILAPVEEMGTGTKLVLAGDEWNEYWYLPASDALATEEMVEFPGLVSLMGIGKLGEFGVLIEVYKQVIKAVTSYDILMGKRGYCLRKLGKIQ
jgi:hypothetical protein